MKRIFKYIFAGAALMGSTTSCDDFLELTPLNEIVAENYWTEKADVMSVLYSCYSGLENPDLIRRMILWGEVRSDNMTYTGGTTRELQQIIQENILETNAWVKWETFYQVINRCNTVIVYAPIVAERDPNYTENEMKATIAEATFLRTLCYFYLVRTFRDVPYTTEPSNDDEDIDGKYRLAPTPMKELLAQLIKDLKAVEGDALRLYPEENYPVNDAANTSRVTTCAIYALLADLYLWSEDYNNCIAYCDKVIDYKLWRYEEMKEETPTMVTYFEMYSDKYPLYTEQPSGNTLGSAYNHIFGEGNSFESIFELYFNSRVNSDFKNEAISDAYGTGTSSGNGGVAATADMYVGVYDKTNTLFAATDCRVVEGIEETSSTYAIRKYVRDEISYIVRSLSDPKPTISQSSNWGSNNFSNWIVYRLTDVMLMKAEAEIELQTPEATNDAFNLISATYNRANNFNSASKDTLDRSNYNSVQMMRELVLDERRRELMFEGKRWYDLVRYSLRLGSNDYLVSSVTKKQKERVSAISLQLQSQDALFWPYLKSELEANPKLKQNPAYYNSDTSQK